MPPISPGEENPYQPSSATTSDDIPTVDPRVIGGISGCLCGCIVALILWLLPLHVAVVVWLFDLKGLFADYMYIALPFHLLLPAATGWLGQWLGDRKGLERPESG